MLSIPLNICIQQIHGPLFSQQNIEAGILRLDKIHPVISGNKLFKLHYFLNEAKLNNRKKIVTFGGAYSNHLVATAFACMELNIPCIGIVRGEKPAHLSGSLIQCKQYGMQLMFISRESYKHKHETGFQKKIHIAEDCLVIPEGGYHPLGAKGASLIMNTLATNNYTHICVPVGTATTLAGVLIGKKENQQVMGFNVLKGMNDIKERIQYLTGKNNNELGYTIINDYHFGGYAKKTNELIEFMNMV